MKHFLQYEVMDFVYDADFVSWVYDGYNDASWTEWLHANPHKQAAASEAKRILEAMQIAPAAVAPQTVDDEVNKLLATIGEGQLPVYRSAPRHRSFWWAAASVILLAGAGWLVLRVASRRSDQAKFRYSVVTATKHLTEQANTSGLPMSITLPDGSVAELAQNSRISYPGSFKDSAMRDVFLSGEAFFKVTKNPAQPFRVFAGEVVTKVLGTSFRVRAFDKDSIINVTVRTGRVNVYSQEAEEGKNNYAARQLHGLLLTPNQEAIYSRQEKKLEKKLLEKPVIIAPGINLKEMVFEEAPVIRVLELLKKAYGISIVYDADILKDCTLTADLTDESLYNKLDYMCKAIDAYYEIVDSEVFIHAKGCH
jgi:ferric-dicitrate binding protein FerR (iron transport regulator)